MHDTLLGSNVNLVKAHNLRAILMSLLFQMPVYRAQLAEDIGLSRTTITNLVDELMREGIVVERGVEEIEGSRRVGRPRMALYLNPQARYALGAHIGVGVYRVGLVDLCSNLIENQLCWFDPKTPHDQVMADIVNKLEQVIEKSGVDRSKIIGLGIGVPAIVDYQTGVFTWAPNLDWENIPMRDWFSEKMGMPVVVENNTRSMALAESYFGSGKDSDSLLFVFGRYGVGSGIVFQRNIFHGSRFGAGEIGHTMLYCQDDHSGCEDGANRTLEDLISEKALLYQAQCKVADNPDSLLASLWNDPVFERKIDALIEAGRKEDPFAMDILTTASRYLGIAIANLVNILNPERVVLGGLFSQGKDLFLPTVRDMVSRYVVGGLGDTVVIEETAFGWRAGVIGACSLALINLFYINSEEKH